MTLLPALTLDTDQVHGNYRLWSVIPANFRNPQYIHLINSYLNTETTATATPANHTATYIMCIISIFWYPDI